jgi:N-methylhydantoinase A
VLAEGQRLGGEVELDLDAATRACERLGKQLGLNALETAWGIRGIANTAMAGAVRAISIGRGYDPRQFALIAFGGAGPMHAADIALEMAMIRVLVPPVPGCHSALGLAVTDVVHDYVATHITNVGATAERVLEPIVSELERVAHEELQSDGVPPAGRELIASLDMRYVGEQFSVNVPLNGRRNRWMDRAVADFHVDHDRLYGFSVPDEPVEVVNVRLQSLGRLHDGGRRRLGTTPPASTDIARPAAEREVAFGSSEHDRVRTPVYERSAFVPGTIIEGPVVVEQSDTTLVVPAHARARCDSGGNLWIEVGE